MALAIREHVPLKDLTTFGIGGTARYFTDISSRDDLAEAVAFSRDANIRLVFLAGGSNVLLPDGEIHALVARITGNSHEFSGSTLAAHAGCNLLALIREATRQNLGGWEKLSGIPGTIGGAVRGNAGAFGPEIKDFLVSAEAVNVETNESRTFDAGACEFSYRNSFFKRHPAWIILRVTIRLAAIDAARSEALIEETIRERERRHLQNVRAAGSFFMNPVAPKDIQALFEQEKGVKAREGRVPAGWLIEKAGMKGERVGGAIASVQHPNYIVNEGAATAADVRELAKKIQDAVEAHFGITLHEEAEVIL